MSTPVHEATPPLRVMTQNFRRSDLPELSPYRLWPVRRPYMAQHIKAVKPAIIGAQELTLTQANHMQTDLGLNWSWIGQHNVRLLYDGLKVDIEEGSHLALDLPSGLRKRYLILARFTDRHSGFGLWVGSLHLASGGEEEPKPEALRRIQMQIVVDKVTAHIAAHPHPEDGKPNLVIMGDLNDPTREARRIAYEQGGWKSLVQRLPLDKITGDTLRSFNGWKSTAGLPHDGKWLDEILTSGITLEDAALRRTCLDAYRRCASDHNGVSADITTG